jgi:hypothetical protein
MYLIREAISEPMICPEKQRFFHIDGQIIGPEGLYMCPEDPKNVGECDVATGHMKGKKLVRKVRRGGL